MDSSMTDNNQRYILHVTPVAGVESQYTLTIESVPIIHNEATYHETQNDNQPAYLPISATLSNQLQTFESHQALSYTSDPAVCIETASYCPATSFALPPSQPEPTSIPSDTEASCSTQCTASTSTQIFHQPISQPESDHVEDKMNKQSRKSTFDSCKNEKNLVVPNGERQHTFDFESCGKLLCTKTRLKDHLKSSHTGKRPYTCDFVNDSNTICGKTFHKERALKQHVGTHVEKIHICSICSKVFAMSKYLKQHIKTHGEKMHICSVCSKGFTTCEYLNRHTRTHTEEKIHICSICSTGFTTSAYLKSHIRTHTKEKMHICSICFKGFTTCEYLNKHIRTHTEEKIHICSICSTGFTMSAYLKSHIRTHTGNKRHVCSICTREFRRKDHFNNHIRMHGNRERKNEYMLYVAPTADMSVATPVHSQYESTIGSVPTNYYGATYHHMENDEQSAYLPTSMPSLNQSQTFKSYQTLSNAVPTTLTTTALNCPSLSQNYSQLNCETSYHTLPPTPPASDNPPFHTNEAKYHQLENDNQSANLMISMPLSNQQQMFESHQTVSYKIPTEHIATALNCPAFEQNYIESSATSFASPPTSTDLTSAAFDTEA